MWGVPIVNGYGDYKARLCGARMIEIGGKEYPAAMPADYRTIYDQYRGAGAEAVAIADSLRKSLRAAVYGNGKAWEDIVGKFVGSPSRATMIAYLEHEIIVLQWISDPVYMSCYAVDRETLPEEQEVAQTRRKILCASKLARKTLIEACKRLGIHRRDMPDFKTAKAAWKAAVMRAHPDKGGSQKCFNNCQLAWDRVKREYGWLD